MSSKYILMRKNNPITMVELDDDGTMLNFSKEIISKELMPLESKGDKDRGIKSWWADRAAPITQGRMRAFLEQKGLPGTLAYLTNNLGLSLMDYYWIRPVDSDIKWEDVNLFDNEFKEERLIPKLSKESPKEASVPKYSPNGSLIGNIEKTWAIINGERCLIKGNSGPLSSESINEVIASKIHELQGYDNYVKYDLIKIKGSRYDYGCVSKLFTSQKYELVSAWALHTSEKKPNHSSNLEHLLNVVKKYGMDADQFRRDLEYQIMTDFIISGYDRHYNNFGVLRDAESLEFVRMAPIFDSGGALFAGEELPNGRGDLLKVKTNSIFGTERKLVEHVSDPMVVDLDKLPPPSYVREMYEKDSQVTAKTVAAVVFAYEKKIDICREIQKGKDPWSKKYSVSGDSGLFAKEEEFDYEPAKGSVN